MEAKNTLAMLAGTESAAFPSLQQGHEEASHFWPTLQQKINPCSDLVIAGEKSVQSSKISHSFA
jgi:hypothetical protein